MSRHFASILVCVLLALDVITPTTRPPLRACRWNFSLLRRLPNFRPSQSRPDSQILPHLTLAMPSLGDLHCFIELAGSRRKLQEFGTSYADGTVETFVAVPNRPQPFRIRLQSTKFIAPGLSMHVFIDGVYQCNRNRQHLKHRTPPDKRSLVDFCVRQKEERQKDGTMIARDWRFEKLNIEENIGCIEVVVLRCVGTRSATSAVKNGFLKPTQLDGAYDESPSEDDHPTIMHLDGTYDDPGYCNGLDGTPGDMGYASSRPHYDDRTWYQLRNAVRPLGSYTAPAPSATGVPTSPYSATGGQQDIWGPNVSPAWGSNAGMTTGFQYGNGPIPHHRRAAPPPTSSVIGQNPNADPLGAGHLDDLLNSMGNGASEAYRATSVGGWGANASQPSQHLPGAWPSSPYEGNVPLDLPNAATGTVGAGWEAPASVAQNTQWNAPTIVAPSLASNTNGWNSGSVATSINSNNTWGSSGHNNARESSNHSRAQSITSGTVSWGDETVRPSSPGAWSGRPSRNFVWRNSNDSESEINSSLSTVKPESSISAFAPTAPRSIHTNPYVPVFAPTASTSPSKLLVSADISPFGPRLLNLNSLDSSSLHQARKAYADYMAEKVNEMKLEESVKAEKAKSEHSAKEQGAGSKSAWGGIASLWGAGEPDDTKTLPAKTVVTVDDDWSQPEKKANGEQTSGWASQEKSTTGEGWYDITEHGQAQKNFCPDNKPASVKASGKGWYDIDSDDEAKNDPWATRKPASVVKGQTVPTKPKEDNDEQGTMALLKDALKGIVGQKDPENDNGWSTKSNKNNRKTSPTAWDTVSKLKPASPDWKAAFAPGWNLSADAPKPSPAVVEPNTRKSRLANYHKNRLSNFPPSADSSAKKHWQFPQKPSSPPKGVNLIPEGFHDKVPAEPAHKISKDTARAKGLEHQVRVGEGVRYGHAVGRPEYVDRFDKPYAVFRFKYRSPAYLQTLFGEEIPSTTVDALTFIPDLKVPTSSDKHTEKHKPRCVSKETLEQLPRDALVDSVLKLHTKMEAQKHAKHSENGTEKWVVRHSGSAEEDEKEKRRKKHRSGRDKERKHKENGGWGDNLNGRKAKSDEGGVTWGMGGWA
ncbi:hypothetical protein CC80DRAFT_533333 [Byssothecium circinans]|uniref:Uncharacterized protein n=1 Tax=Byssothecium circinans TaxID=147558 RepID=A0A6A5U1S9_9PLEO|nr:hypothetical protein CC80DRAFT_533333 [Byssothecium circinans]